MGYDLHVTRGEGNPILESEWLSYVRSDREFELTGVAEMPTPDGTLRYESPGLACWRGHPGGEPVWFDFRPGEVVVKHPDQATIDKMLAVARALDARVEGDDGEIYEAPGSPPRPPRMSLAARVRGWLSRLRPVPEAEPVAVPFIVGQRVHFFGQEGVVVAIDVAANHGLGRIEVRFDDGRVLAFTAVAHGLEPAPGDPDSAG